MVTLSNQKMMIMTVRLQKKKSSSLVKINKVKKMMSKWTKSKNPQSKKNCPVKSTSHSMITLVISKNLKRKLNLMKRMSNSKMKRHLS